MLGGTAIDESSSREPGEEHGGGADEGAGGRAGDKTGGRWLVLRKLRGLAVDRLERGRLTGRVPRAAVRDLATSNLLALSDCGGRGRFPGDA